MSEHFIALVPNDPHARPSRDKLERLKTTLAQICKTHDARIKDYGTRLQFIDCGKNFQYILCPDCKAQVDMEWWGKRMDHAWDDDDGFHMCGLEMPCCGATTRLDTLVYDPPQRFSTWFVSARDSGHGKLTETELAALEKGAGLPILSIYQAY